jgi:hypothetical protein
MNWFYFIIGFAIGMIASGMLLIILVHFQKGFKEDINEKAKKVFNEEK